MRKNPNERLDAADAKAIDTLPRLANLQNQQSQEKMLMYQHQVRGMTFMAGSDLTW